MRAFLLATAVLALTACSASHDADTASGAQPSGGGTSRSYAISGFSSVDLRGSDDADVRVGGQFAVRATGPVKELDDLIIDKKGDTLRISRRGGVHVGFTAGRDVKVFVTMPRITSASISGSGDMSIDRVDGGQFAAASSGSGDLSITHLHADAATLSLSGSGEISAAGNVNQLTISSQGSGDVDAGDLTASAAKVALAGSGDVTVKVNGPATVSSMGSGDVDLGSGAQCTTSKTGSGEVHCGH